MKTDGDTALPRPRCTHSAATQRLSIVAPLHAWHRQNSRTAQEESHVKRTIALQHWRWLAGAALLIASTACGHNTPAVPMPTPSTSTSLQGVWTGVITDSVLGAGALTFDLQPKYPGLSGTVVTGSWRAVFTASGQEYRDAVEGVLLPLPISQALFTATCSFAPPFFNVPAGLSFNVLLSDRRMSGTYGSGGCSGFGTGSIDLTRQ